MSGRVVQIFGGVALVQRQDTYELHEEGALLAVTTSTDAALRLFFRRALDIATARARGNGQKAEVALTAAGKAVFCAAPEPEPAPEPELPKKKTATAFQKPTVAEIEAYCRERGRGIDAQAVYDHYEANGWMVGRTKMKDWKAAVRTWERKEQEGAYSAPTRRRRGPELTNPEQSSLDMEGYEEALLKYRPIFQKDTVDGEREART